MPTSLLESPDDDDDLAKRKRVSRELFQQAFLHQEEMYGKLLEVWDMEDGSKNFDYKKKVTSCLRRIVGMGVATGGVWTGNIRAVRHVISMRTEEAAEEEIFEVYTKIAVKMIEQEAMLFSDFKQLPHGGYRPDNWKV
jgi:thymidylate synthase ThyX